MRKTSIKIIKKDRPPAILHLIMALFTHPYHFPSIMLNHFFFHSISSNDFMKASKLLTSIVPANLPERASFIAAIVSSFGSEYTASIKVLSTNLFRLVPARFATSPHVNGTMFVFLLLLPCCLCIILYSFSVSNLHLDI